MDRRDFLKLFAVGAVGLYVPKRSYFFMPRTQLRDVQIPIIPFQHEDIGAVFTPDVYRETVPVCLPFITVQVLVDLNTELIQNYKVPDGLLGEAGQRPGIFNHLIGRRVYEPAKISSTLRNYSRRDLLANQNVF